jgi:hypothetical protein
MGRITVLKGENQTLSTGSVLLIFSTPAAGTAGARVKIKRLEISQSGSTTLAMIRGEFFTRDNAGTLTTTSLAPTMVKPIGGAASAFAGNTSVIGGTARSGITSSADSGGTYVSIYPFNFANTAGYLFKPAPDEEFEVPASTFFGVRFVSAPGTLTGWTFALTMEEEG